MAAYQSIAEDDDEPLARTETAHMATTTVKVDGMTCGACTSAVEAGFKDVSGAGVVSVSLVMGRAVVHHDPEKLSAEQVAEIIEDRGFDAEVLSTNLPTFNHAMVRLEGSTKREGHPGPKKSTTTVAIAGMTCGACTSSVEAGFKDVSGVSNMSVSLLSERATIEHDPALISPDRIAEIIEDRGFEATVLDTKIQEEEPQPFGAANIGSGSFKADTATTTVAIEGMTCGACTSAVEGAFSHLPGLVHFRISLLAERAVITHEPSKLSVETIIETIDDAGLAPS